MGSFEIRRLCGALICTISPCLIITTADGQYCYSPAAYKPKSQLYSEASLDPARYISGLTDFRATPIYPGTRRSASFVSVLGSREAPVATLDATAIFQKTSTGAASGSQTNG